MALALTFHADILINTESLSYEEWLTHRRSGIGGFDLAAICGILNGEPPSMST